ncbi:hypothetical protein D1610_11730 [Sphingomonas gilva]|uniref:Phage tail protein n=1 Tax=Sphingomonas gilva TaxID=2305907 RepID=A0A396RPL9_9SPHN|nr:phage GP46 family protein [Sphingomonas gilva]RHW17212.1 hypothetical protein D1610_11730 [Sphingomonas gilva]
MTDIALIWDAEPGAADVALEGGRLVTDDGLRTAILISLFSDARAQDDDPLPQPGADRRGWWGDAFGTEGDATGSRLWLLSREKITAATVARAREYAREALAWLTADGVCSAYAIEAEAQAPDILAIGVVLDRPEGPARQRYDFTWNASTGAVA